jgi:hypothetical protein
LNSLRSLKRSFSAADLHLQALIDHTAVRAMVNFTMTVGTHRSHEIGVTDSDIVLSSVTVQGSFVPRRDLGRRSAA